MPSQLEQKAEGKSTSFNLTSGSFKNVIPISRKRKMSKISFENNKNLDYSQNTLFNFVIEAEDSFSAHIILQSFKFINILIQSLSNNANLQLEYAQSGILWRQLVYLMSNSNNSTLEMILDPVIIEKIMLKTLRNFFSNCNHILTRRTSKEEAKLEENEGVSEPEKLTEYFNACISLLGQNMLKKLILPIDVNEEGVIKFLEDHDNSPLFLEMYRSNHLKSFDMIWNKQTREELKEVLTKELENIYQGKVQWDVNPYLNYQYAEHDKELIVGNVFLSLVNRDKEFRPKDPQDFIDKLIDKLDEVKDDSIQTLEVVKTIKSCSSMSELSTINQRTFWSFFEFTESFVNDFMENEEI